MRSKRGDGMKPGIHINIREFENYVSNVRLTKDDMLDIEKPGAMVLRNGIVMRVPKDTSATANSTRQHIIEASSKRVVDDVGPETDYAPYIEYGVRTKPNYPIQPYIRPTVSEDGSTVIKVISTAYGRKIADKWQR